MNQNTVKNSERDEKMASAPMKFQTPNMPLESRSLNLNNPIGGPIMRQPEIGQQNITVRNGNLNIQPQLLQQKNPPLNYQQGFKPLLPGEQEKIQNAPGNSNYPRPNGNLRDQSEFQKSGGSILAQRTMNEAPPRFIVPQQPIRPIYDPSRQATQQQMEVMRNQAVRQQLTEAESFRRNEGGTRNVLENLTKKSPNLELNSSEESDQIKQKLINESQPEFQKEITEKAKPKEPDFETQKEVLKVPSQNLSQNSSREKTQENANSANLKLKKKELTKIDPDIAIGLVSKQIKFFEENDTAKTPLTPESITVKQNSRRGSSHELDKCKLNKNDLESGVDSTPMVHPDLRSIYQAPRKVARIPRLKSKRIFKSNSKKILKTERPNESFKLKSSWNSLHFNQSKFFTSSNKINNKSKRNITQSSKNELLTFFQNSKYFQELKKGGNYNSHQSGTKDKIIYKPSTNGDIVTPKKTPSKLPAPSKKNSTVSSPTKTPLKSPGTPGAKSLPKTPETPSPPTPLIKKVPMNKIQVGAAPSPNLKAVRSKVGSLVNTTHKPGGGNIKIESHKIDFSKTQPRIEAKNDQYAPSGGDKKITQVKLQWSAKSKVGSMENATYKPGGGDKKIESVKLDFKEKAKPKVGSKDNVKHVPGGGAVKIENQKLEFKAQSKVGSLDNVKHKPGGGDIKIFDDKTYLKQISGNSSEGRVSGTQSLRDLSIVRQVEGRSAPGTPGRKTAVKIKKTTTINSSEGNSTLKNVTEVVVESQTPKKEKPMSKITHQQVKLTYSKLSSPIKTEGKIPSAEVIRVPARNKAPILKPNLDIKDALNSGNFDSDFKSSVKIKNTNFNNTLTSKDFKNLENFKQNSESSNLSDDKLNMKTDSGMTKFLQDEIAAHEKVGEIWKEMNDLEKKKEDSKPNAFSNISQQGSHIQLTSSKASNEIHNLSGPKATPPHMNSSFLQTNNFQTSQKTIQTQNSYQTFLQSEQQHPQPISKQILTTSFQPQGNKLQ